MLTFRAKHDGWASKFKSSSIVKSIKKNESDDFDTEYVDVDGLLWTYVECYQKYMRDRRVKMHTEYMKQMANLESRDEITLDNIESTLNLAQPTK